MTFPPKLKCLTIITVSLDNKLHWCFFLTWNILFFFLISLFVVISSLFPQFPHSRTACQSSSTLVSSVYSNYAAVSHIMLLLIYWWHNMRGGGGSGWRRWWWRWRCWVGAGVRWLLPCTCVFTHLFHLQVVWHTHTYTHTHAEQYVATVTLKDQRGPFKSVSRHPLHVSPSAISAKKKKKKSPPVELPMVLMCFFFFPSDTTQKKTKKQHFPK